ncbi:LasU family protein [Pediococcus argentinicus]|nr:LasU family protein [Pediococcus argentinicus]NKZ22178.1 hypothetical protein [Pediococcus argentinicus]GEP19227.1 hypothetical protein LSA03_06110 [Pediococcus argentinicus]
MKKALILLPTFILFAVVIIGFVATSLSTGARNDLLAIGAVGLIGYSFIAIFMYVMSFSYKGQSNKKLSELPSATRWVLIYLIAVMVVTLIVSIYFMVHN